jgi:hypothetical protein
MRFWLRLCRATVCVLCLSATASNYALSQQAYSFVAHSPTPHGLTVTKMMTDDKLFDQVPFDTEDQNACSPADPDFGWRGVKVRAPSQVVLSGKDAPQLGLRIPLCGVYRLDLAKVIQHPGRLMLVVIDDATGKTYRGAIVDRDPSPKIPPPRSAPIDPAIYKNQAFGAYFNYDVAAYVALPLQPARYRIKVEWSGYESNEVSIAVVQRP